LEELPIEVVGVLVPGIYAASCRKFLDNERRHSRRLSILSHAVAIHPNHTADVTKEDWQTIVELAHRDDVVAIGETGLDRYWDDAPIDVQIDFLYRHIEL
jgi:TatD DNase family protein